MVGSANHGPPIVNRPLVFYITDHGLGHAARSLEVVAALQRTHPVIVVTTVDPDYLGRQLGDQLRLEARALDCGVVQIDSVRSNEAATLEAVRAMRREAPGVVQREAEFLRKVGAQTVLVDAPCLPLEAAARVGIPGLAVTSFGWHFIYRHFQGQDPEWKTLCSWMADSYGHASGLLQFPLGQPIESIGVRQEIPLVARPGRSCREEIARLSGADPERRWVLLWFQKFEMDWSPLRDSGYEFFVVPPLKAPARDVPEPFRGSNFRDMVASADVVVSKPGFGMISDCIANQRPLVYAPRPNFSESALLEEGIEKYLRHARLTQEELYGGHWLRALEEAMACPAPSQGLEVGGADRIAQAILQWPRPLASAGPEAGGRERNA